MSLLQELSKTRITFFKAGEKDKASLLATLISEAKTDALKVEKRDPTDDEMLAKIRKFIKNNDEALKVVEGDAADKLKAENDLLGQWLPQMMDADAVKALVAQIVADNPGANMGQIMGQLKGRPDVDMKIASGLVKDALA